MNGLRLVPDGIGRNDTRLLVDTQHLANIGRAVAEETRGVAGNDRRRKTRSEELGRDRRLDVQLSVALRRVLLTTDT